MLKEEDLYTQPSESGHFGEFGGRFVAETLTHALDEVVTALGDGQLDKI